MKRLFIIPLILTIALMNIVETGFSRCPELSSAGAMKARNSKIHLFNGKNLDGWYTFLKGKGRNNDPNKVFTVQNGLIRISGEEFGCITSNDDYDNYKLEVEFKWGELTFTPRVGKARDSGVLLNSTGKDGGYSGIWMHSIECQLIEGGTGDMLVVGDGSKKFSLTCPVEAEKQGGSYVFKPNGAPATIHEGRINWYGRDPAWKDVKEFRGAKDIEKPIGKWNELVCIVQGKEITIYLNGTLVNHAMDVQPRKGRIQIQSEGAEILLRRVDLIPLSQN
jgi:hypothetical protein